MNDKLDIINEKKFKSDAILNNTQINIKDIFDLDQFPDILKNQSHDEAKMTFDLLYKTSNHSIINKIGNSGGFTALHWMCIKNEYELIGYLIEKFNVDVNCKAEMGETPLLISIRNCNYLAIELLIKNGADLKVRDVYDRSIVHWIAYTGKVVVMYYFQKYHSIINLNDIDKFLQNPLHIACSLGSFDLINYLIENGQINLYAQDANGNTCMHLAAKAGLPRACWQISQQNKGECIRLINMRNKKNQLPIDLIANENEPPFQKIKDWLVTESKTNKWLLSKIKSKNVFLLSSNYKMKVELIFSILSYPIAFTLPILIQYFLFDQYYLTIWRGIINYAGLLFSFSFVSRKHRIDHVSSLKNPFFLGFFATIVTHVLCIVYFDILNPLDLRRTLDRYSIFVTILVAISVYKILNVKTGTCESIKKQDGTPYELHDLMKLNVRENLRYTKDSFNWLTQPGHPNVYIKQNPIPQAFFCETCLIVQMIPTKHCKLCNECCPKFDHHCIYINGCVGAKNHKHFIFFLISTLLAFFGFFYGSLSYLASEAEKIRLANLNIPLDNQITILYLCIASRFHVRLIAVLILFTLTGFLIMTLFLNQLKSISLGYTKFFTPPEYFLKIKDEFKTWSGCTRFRLKNLYTFLFGSCHENEALYIKNQKDYFEIFINGKSNNNNSISQHTYPGDTKYQPNEKKNII